MIRATNKTLLSVVKIAAVGHAGPTDLEVSV